MRTARSSSRHGESPPPRSRPPWSRHPQRRHPPGTRPPGTHPPGAGTPQDQTPPGPTPPEQAPPRTRPPSWSRHPRGPDPPCGQTHTCKNIIRGPTRTGKPGKMGRHFPVREKSGNFEQTGKVREKSGKTTQNTGKLRKFQKKILCYFSMIFKWTVYYLLKCIKFSVKKIKH